MLFILTYKAMMAWSSIIWDCYLLQLKQREVTKHSKGTVKAKILLSPGQWNVRKWLLSRFSSTIFLFVIFSNLFSCQIWKCVRCFIQTEKFADCSSIQVKRGGLKWDTVDVSHWYPLIQPVLCWSFTASLCLLQLVLSTYAHVQTLQFRQWLIVHNSGG